MRHFLGLQRWRFHNSRLCASLVAPGVALWLGQDGDLSCSCLSSFYVTVHQLLAFGGSNFPLQNCFSCLPWINLLLLLALLKSLQGHTIALCYGYLLTCLFLTKMWTLGQRLVYSRDSMKKKYSSIFIIVNSSLLIKFWLLYGTMI